MIRYFAYGSNMDKDDLDKWCIKRKHPIIKFKKIIPVKLSGYKLCFNYYSSTRNAGAANITKDDDSFLYGLLVDIEDPEITIIREKEGYPNYYNEIYVSVESSKGEIIKDVVTYKVVKKRESIENIKPTFYYLNLIIKNSEKYGFPEDYIGYLNTFKV